MTFKDTIKSMIIMHPLIFPTKLSVYDHLFLTNGNGYRWENGELISLDYNKTNYSVEDGLEALFNNEYQYQLLESYISNFDDPKEFVSYLKKENKQKLKLVKRILNAENIVEEELHMSNKEEEILHLLYPLSKYSAILNIPTDIKDDWKDAIKEFLDFIMTSEEDKVIKYRNQYINELSEIQYKIL